MREEQSFTSSSKLVGSVHGATSISMTIWMNHTTITHTCRQFRQELPQARLEPAEVQSDNLYEFGRTLYLQATTAGLWQIYYASGS